MNLSTRLWLLWFRISPRARGYRAGLGAAAVMVHGVPHEHPDGGHVCLYADLDGTTDGACRYPGKHGGCLPDGRTGADLEYRSYRDLPTVDAGAHFRRRMCAGLLELAGVAMWCYACFEVLVYDGPHYLAVYVLCLILLYVSLQLRDWSNQVARGA